MLPSLIITLREGVEAALIVGIIAAFLVKEGRRDAMGRMWLGVGLAVLICAAVGIGLNIVNRQLPQREQEGLETVIGLIAVAAVSYMIVWMRRNARGLKSELEGHAASALRSGTTLALVAMAFLAVLREGFETSVFLLAVFQESSDTLAAGAGAVLGLTIAIAIGVAIYRGGVKINLSRFFRLTGLVLVFVAAGLLATTMHTAHEAGWLNQMQGQAADLSWFVQPGTWTGALLTGMLGLQPKPTTIEVTVYLLYAVPMALYVAWPDRWRPGARKVAARASSVTTATLACSAAAVFAVVLAGCGESTSNADGKLVKISLSDAGCKPTDLKLPAGPTTFDVTNEGTAKVTEYEILRGDSILGEVENIGATLSKSFTLTLEPGKYTTYCPGGDVEKGTLVVTGSANTAGSAEGRAAVNDYRAYLERNADRLVAATAAFTDSVKAGDVAAAKRQYAPARVFYERIEPVAESFGDLDPAIDARAGDVPKSQWQGFHVIEQALWKQDSTAGMSGVASQLQRDVARLRSKIDGVKLEPAQIANGANELLSEVSQSKVTGEEERYSHTDLYDFAANVAGARAAFDAVAPLLDEQSLKREINRRFDEIESSLDRYRRGNGWASYTDLTQAQIRQLSQQIDALAEPLSQVPARVAGN